MCFPAGLAKLTVWPPFQLSVYTTTRSNLGAENNVDLVLNVEDFDVESKFERYGYGTKYQWLGSCHPMSFKSQPSAQSRVTLRKL